MKQTKLQTKTDAELVAERVKLLFAFCGELIPYKEMLKDTLQLANRRSGFAMDAAPILEAYGRDWEADHFEAELRASTALLELVVLW
jgi:hypothetical protein